MKACTPCLECHMNNRNLPDATIVAYRGNSYIPDDFPTTFKTDPMNIRDSITQRYTKKPVRFTCNHIFEHGIIKAYLKADLPEPYGNRCPKCHRVLTPQEKKLKIDSEVKTRTKKVLDEKPDIYEEDLPVATKTTWRLLGNSLVGSGSEKLYIESGLEHYQKKYSHFWNAETANGLWITALCLSIVTNGIFLCSLCCT